MKTIPAHQGKKHSRETAGEKVFNVADIVIMLIVCVIILIPMLNVVSVSMSDDKYVAAAQVSFWPRGLNFKAYETVLQSNKLLRSFLNTVFVTICSCVCSLTMTCLAAYPLAYGKFYGKRIYSLMILLTMWFSGGMIPTYMVINKLGLINSLASLIIVPLIMAYYVVVLRAFFASIPVSLIESARIDGAGEFQILWSVVIPLSKAALATTGLWTIVARWNEFLNPILYLKDYRKYTMQIVLRDIVLASSASQYDIDMESTALGEQVRNATIVVTMLPVLVVYPFLQKHFVKGVMLGAVKG
ncbi:MAG: carbohydrate ABC transporter permease [Clostridia bacterium]|nr:carbohydrate ABC transporter permease [Clostridia bacterium]